MNKPSHTAPGTTCALAIRKVLLASAVAAMGGTAHASQPPDNVVSDAGADTAMGTDALISLTTGYQNTAAGYGALQLNQVGYKNTAMGFAALQSSMGSDNAAFGSGALNLSEGGNDNAAFGMDALYYNLSGTANTATGSHALYKNTSSYNTAVGFTALSANSGGTMNSAFGLAALGNGAEGSYNTALGTEALLENNGGNYNTAVGLMALIDNSSGSFNTASGSYALVTNVNGNSNTGVGYSALYSNNGGSVNVAVGQNALYSDVSGGNNIAIGAMSGYDITGSNNIDIGSMGASGDNGIVRIGTAGTQTKVFIAGVESNKVTGNAVYVTASGALGVLASSERYKNAIETMGSDTEKLMRLRPVSFHLKTDPNGAVQYGLIAEEVDKIYPELVIRDEAGQIQGVRYDELAPMLLNVVQKQQKQMSAQDAAIEAQATEVSAMKLQFAELAQQNRELQAALLQRSVPDARLAMR
jgi:hypothetical protein